METRKTYQPISYETVRQFCERGKLSRRKFDYLKAAGVIPVIQTGPRFIRINPQLADEALARYQTGGAK